MSHNPLPQSPAPPNGAPTDSSVPAQGLSQDTKDQTLRRQVTITNPHGFHMRPATVFAEAANGFKSTVTLAKADQRVNGKSPLELLFLAAEQGTEIDLEVCGVDAGEAIARLAEILAAPSADDLP